MDYLSQIKDITPDGPFVVVSTKKGNIVLTVEEALDRAEAIRHCTTEDERGKHVKDLYNAIMSSALHARTYQQSQVRKGILETEIAVAKLRQLELYRIRRGASTARRRKDQEVRLS